MMFKVGDFIKGKKNNGYSITNEEMTRGQILEIKGSLVEIKILEHLDKDEIGQTYEVTRDNFEECFEIPKAFTKSDLRDGDIVTLRNGSRTTIKGERIIDEAGTSVNKLENYNDDLTQRIIKEHDIIKVERPVQYETVYERKEEILDEAEKRWIDNFIRTTGIKVKYIQKWLGASCENEYLEIEYSNYWSNNETLFLPVFKKDTKYKGMKTNKKYTLEELRIIKE